MRRLRGVSEDCERQGHWLASRERREWARRRRRCVLSKRCFVKLGVISNTLDVGVESECAPNGGVREDKVGVDIEEDGCEDCRATSAGAEEASGVDALFVGFRREVGTVVVQLNARKREKGQLSTRYEVEWYQYSLEALLQTSRTPGPSGMAQNALQSVAIC